MFFFVNLGLLVKHWYNVFPTWRISSFCCKGVVRHHLLKKYFIDLKMTVSCEISFQCKFLLIGTMSGSILRTWGIILHVICYLMDIRNGTRDLIRLLSATNLCKIHDTENVRKRSTTKTNEVLYWIAIDFWKTWKCWLTINYKYDFSSFWKR